MAAPSAALPIDRGRGWTWLGRFRRGARPARGHDSQNKENIDQQPRPQNEKDSTHEATTIGFDLRCDGHSLDRRETRVCPLSNIHAVSDPLSGTQCSGPSRAASGTKQQCKHLQNLRAKSSVRD